MPVRRRLPLIRTLMSLGAGLVLVTAAALTLLRLDRIRVAPGLLRGGSTPIFAPHDGLIETVLVRAGETVQPGTPLLQLDTRELVAAAARSQSAIETLRIRRSASLAQQTHLEGTVQPREREEAGRQVERARLKRTQAEIAAEATSRLGEAGIAGQLQVRQSELDLKLAAVALTDAEQAVTLLRERQRAQLDALAAEVLRLSGEIDAETTQGKATLAKIDDSLLRATVGGVVATEHLDELSGRSVHAGDEILRLAVATPGMFEGMLSDDARAQVRPDQRVRIRLEGYPWLIYGTLKGRVVRVSDRRESEAGYPVEVELDPASAPGLLSDGMRGTARIVIGDKVSLLRMLLESATGKIGV